MHKKKIIFFGGGKFQKKIIKILRSKFFIITIDANEKAESSKISDIFLNYNFDEINKLYKYLKKKKIHPKNIISLNSDAGYIAAEKLRNKFKLNSLNSKTFNIFFDKYYLLKFLKKNQFPCSDFSLFKNKKLKDYFVKPRKSSGSRDIIFSKKNKINHKMVSQNYIIHKKISGQEFVIDGLISNKKIINFLISKKIKFKNSDTVSQTIYSKPNILNNYLQNKCLHTISDFLNKSGYNYGIFHIEFILNNSEFYIIDAAPRGPGFFVFEDYVIKRLGKENILNFANNDKFIYHKKRKKFNSMFVYFLPTKNGIFKNIEFKKKLKHLKFQKFIKNNSKTTSVKIDNDRLGSLTLYSYKKIDIDDEIKKINKAINVKYY